MAGTIFPDRENPETTSESVQIDQLVDLDTDLKLSREDTQRARELLMILSRMFGQIDDLESCGIACRERRARLQRQQELLTALDQKFGTV